MEDLYPSRYKMKTYLIEYIFICILYTHFKKQYTLFGSYCRLFEEYGSLEEVEERTERLGTEK